MTFPGRDSVRLSGERRVRLRLSLRYLVQPTGEARRSWRVAIVGYEYEFQDAFAQRILAYHWHPVGRSRVASPHLHTRQTSPIDLTRAHLPTGQVPLAAVLRFAVAELGVRPLRPDWNAVLEESERALQAL